MIYKALEIAAKAHRNQNRKGTDIPYITHPAAVALMLCKAGCSEDVIATGILYDTIEDTTITIDFIRDNFGEKVASIVEGCSEPDKTLPWEDRKKHTLEYLKTAPLEVKLVVCADKLHNIMSIANEYSKIGEDVWKRFKRGKEEQEWYFRGLVESLYYRNEDRGPATIFEDFRTQVEMLFVP